MVSKAQGPNLGQENLRINLAGILSHNLPCGGYIEQPARKSGRIASGRPRCRKCQRFVGRKAWRSFQADLRAGALKAQFLEPTKAVDTSSRYWFHTTRGAERSRDFWDDLGVEVSKVIVPGQGSLAGLLLGQDYSKQRRMVSEELR